MTLQSQAPPTINTANELSSSFFSQISARVDVTAVTTDSTGFRATPSSF